jgi:peptidoglycan/LPS O-acetylase OafA/YrhL
MLMFLGGMLMWEIVEGRRLIKRLPVSLEPIVIALYGCSFVQMGLTSVTEPISTFVPLGSFVRILLFVASTLLCLYGVFGGGLLSRVFSWDWLRWTGNFSYSFYLCHGLALHALRLLIGAAIGEHPVSTPTYLLLLACGLAIALLGSALMFVFVEKPLSLPIRKGTFKGPQQLAASGT